MWPSLRPSQRMQVAAAISPQSTSATVTTGWVNAADWENFLFELNIGVISAGGSVAASLKQAQDGTGTNAKALNNVAGNALAITAMTQAGGNSSELALINANAADLDTNNGFTFIEGAVTVSGAAALVSAVLWGIDAKYPTADSTADGDEATTVNQIVS